MPEKRDESFSTKNRLRKSNDFKRVFSKGKRIATPFFVTYSLPNRLPFSRLGIQVKATLGTATRRNYMKRIVREAFRRMKGDFCQPLDLVFIAEKPMSNLKYRQLEEALRKALVEYFT